MLTIIIAIFVVLLAALFVFAATRPDTFRTQRTATIKAPPENIFVLFDDLHSWGAWSPWEKVDPALKRNYSGAPKGEGAVYEWQGNNKVGGTHGDHRVISDKQDLNQTGFLQAIRSA